eukprot:162263-Chlamydomonas_euryale.AAC.4
MERAWAPGKVCLGATFFYLNDMSMPWCCLQLSASMPMTMAPLMAWCQNTQLGRAKGESHLPVATCEP